MASDSRLFHGINFWLSQRTPSRARFVDDIKKHGGSIVPLEKLADILIVDHIRKDSPPGSCSYRFIEESIRNGRLADKEDHLVIQHPTGNGTIRMPAIGSKATRTPFTEADDACLRQWVRQNRNRSLLGNVIFQELAAKNNRHTPQSWRDRWVKKLQHTTNLYESDADTTSSPPPSHSAQQTRASNIAPPRLTVPVQAPSSRTTPQQGSGIRGQVSRTSNEEQLKNGFHQSPTTRQPAYSSTALPPSNRDLKARDRLVPSSAPLRTSSNNRAESFIRPEKPLADVARQAALHSSKRASVNSIQLDRHQNDPSDASSRQLRKISDLTSGDDEVLPRSTRMTTGARSELPSSHKSPRAKAESDTKATHLDKPVADIKRPVSIRTTHPSDNRASTGNLSSDASRRLLVPDKDHHSESMNHASPVPDPVIEQEDSGSEHAEWEDEDLAIKVWTKLLYDLGEEDHDKVNDMACLIANAGIIKDLNEEDFSTAWDNWWQTNPHRTEDEWFALWNESCMPFYMAHGKRFQNLYKIAVQTASDSEDEEEDETAELQEEAEEVSSPPPNIPQLALRPSPAIKKTEQRNLSKKESPELGSERFKQPSYARSSLELGNAIPRLAIREPSIELGTNRRRDFLTPDPQQTSSSRKRQLASSEVPESPQITQRIASSSNKRPRRDLNHSTTRGRRQEISASPEESYTEENHIEWLMNRSPDRESSLSSQDSDDSVLPGQFISKPRISLPFPSESLSGPRVQANVDQQIWSEEADALRSSDNGGRRGPESSDSESDVEVLEPSTGRNAKATPQRVTQRDIEPKEENDPPEQSLFVSDDEEENHHHHPEEDVDIPPASSVPFFEGDDAEAHHNFDDLASQMGKHSKSRRAEPQVENSRTNTEHSEPTQPESDWQIDSDDEFEDAAEWLNEQVAEGYDEQLVKEILNATTMQAKLARRLLKHYLRHNRIPQTKRGVWTPEDDEKLCIHSRAGNKSLIKKHGAEALQRRRKHLETMKRGL